MKTCQSTSEKGRTWRWSLIVDDCQWWLWKHEKLIVTEKQTTIGLGPLQSGPLYSLNNRIWKGAKTKRMSHCLNKPNLEINASIKLHSQEKRYWLLNGWKSEEKLVVLDIKANLGFNNLNLPEDPEELDFSAHIEDVSQNLPHLIVLIALLWGHGSRESSLKSTIQEDKHVTTISKVMLGTR